MLNFSLSRLFRQDRVLPLNEKGRYMTEEEARELSSGFNKHLKQYSIQIEEFTNRNNNLHDKLLVASQRNKKAELIISSKHEELKVLEKELNEKISSLDSLESSIENENLNVQTIN